MSELISETPITMAELREEVKKLKKRDTELNIRATKTEEYLNKFSALDSKKAVELTKKLTDLDIPRLKEVHIIKIVDLLPKTVDDLKLILQGYTLTVSKDNLMKIVGAVKDIAK